MYNDREDKKRRRALQRAKMGSNWSELTSGLEDGHSKGRGSGGSSYGEIESAVSDADAATRGRTTTLRSSSLLSQINSRSSRVERSGGGDDDVPFRDPNDVRRRREQRAAAVAKRRKARASATGVASVTAFDHANRPRKRVGADVDVGDGTEHPLYAAAAAAADRRKREKRKRLEPWRVREEGDGLSLATEDDSVWRGGGRGEEEGKRGANWKILKNQGLKPHRKKEMRNPR